MHARAEVSLADLSTPWTSRAGQGPVLRGRRTGYGDCMVHFLPGNGFSGGVYWPFLRRLLPDCGLFLHDIEGHGASDAPQRFSGVRALAARVPQVIREQGLDRGGGLVGMGHSFGAALTLKVAAQNPGLFRALVLLDPIVLPPAVWAGWRALSRFGMNPMARSARARRERWPSRSEALARLRDRGIYRGWTEEALESFVDHATFEADGGRQLCCPPRLEAEIFENPVYPWQAFRQVQVPILFLHGAQSYPFFAAATRRARRLNAQVEVQTLPGGHCFMQEQPEPAATAVLDFLRSAAR